MLWHHFLLQHITIAIVVNVFNKLVQVRECAVYGDYYYYYDCDLGPTYISNVIPFFSSIGNLKSLPLMLYLKLCLDGPDMIDHMFLSYIHPVIVFTMAVIVFVSARKFVWAAQRVNKYVNSKSICLFAAVI